MNRLILIGNGFDLAHGMETSYAQFMLSYVKNCFFEAVKKGSFNNSVFKIDLRTQPVDGSIETMSTIDEILNDNSFVNQVHLEFYRILFNKYNLNRWVDIEYEYYDQIREILKPNNPYKNKNISDLNTAFENIKNEMEKYLSKIKRPKVSNEYLDIFNLHTDCRQYGTEVFANDIVPLQNTLMLNFNYTDTPQLYLNQIRYLTGSIDVINIHGMLSNLNYPIIFGFGDEFDSTSLLIEHETNRGFMKYIKSFSYSKNHNYFKLMKFVKGSPFEVFILGHSCGISDRTMLHSIFEHDNCRSIKIFYHQLRNQNNYLEIYQDIYRIFNDKGLMRDKIENFDFCSPMPQVY